MFNPGEPFNPPSDVLRHYTDRAADAEYVALQNYGIDDLGPFMDRLASLKHMRHLNLSGNNLTSLPLNMSKLAALELLDVSGNNFRSAEQVISGLFSLPNLIHLKISLPEAEENKIVATLTNVQTLNGVELDEAEDDPEERARKADEAAAKLVAPPPRGYDISTQGVRLQLDYKPWSLQDTEKFASLYGVVGRVSGKASSPEEYGDFSRTVMAHYYSRSKSDSDLLKLQVHQFNAAALLLEYSFDELARVCSKFGSDVSDAMQAIFEQHLELVRRASVTMSVMQEDRDRRIAAVQEDLRKEILLRERTQRAYEANFGTTIAGGRMQYGDEEMRRGPQPYGLPQHYPGPARDAAAAANGEEQVPDNILLALLASTTKEVSLKELRAFLFVLFKSKANHDEANALARLPPETLEQHFYTLLCSKTTKEETVKSRIAALYKAIAKHSKANIDVEIVAKILKNELDEGYYHHNKEWERITFDTIHASLTNAEKQEERLGVLGNADGALGERQVKEVLELLVPWPAARRAALIKRVSLKMRRKEFEPDQYVIGYADLGRLVLQFFLEEHLENIDAFAQLFRRQDADRTGVLGTNQFRNILAVLFPNLSSWKAQQITTSADPFDSNVVNFNTAVQVIDAYKASEANAATNRIQGEIDRRRGVAPAPQQPSSAPLSQLPPKKQYGSGGGVRNAGVDASSSPLGEIPRTSQSIGASTSLAPSMEASSVPRGTSASKPRQDTGLFSR